MSELIKKIESVHMSLEIYENRLAIIPKGGILSPRGISGKKEILYTSITAIQYKEAAFLRSGFIQFTVQGAREAGKGLIEAVYDENSFLFNSEHNQEISELKDFIFSKIQTQSTSAPLSIADELSKLKELQVQGYITSEEFEELKNKAIEKYKLG